ncbi:MAG: hypothetical protein FJZ00_12500 [Candidatus Sericytochromatia bacterium]|uniref:Glycoside hydrolase family 5 domain-containing protein n=1 Tax=Candidatus Tanganyikabacteria bacterium TaxID=2961651 RepID=A0A937X4L7_9BACT|nr:hypothetical protein [Candidatus Tanganyikabacteria bacterium]
MLGANLPWVHYGGDFGKSAWQPAGGLSANPEAARKLDHTFAKFAQDGIGHVRWWLFGDGRGGIRWASDGTPLGLDDKVFADMDAALAAARKHGIKITFSLIDFLFLRGDRRPAGKVQTGGHADVIKDPRKREAFIRDVVTPILERYGRDPAIEAWDLINEPEWETVGERGWNFLKSPWRGDMRAYLKAATDAVHAHTDQWATVGLASTRGLGLVKGLGLDLYHAHWYDGHDWLLSGLTKPVSDFKLDKPLILGEFPTRKSRRTPAEILTAAQKAGYGGTMLWSALSEDPFAGYDAVRASMKQWAREHADDLSPGSASRTIPRQTFFGG